MKPPARRSGQPLQFGFLPSPPPLPRIVARAMACCALAQRVEVEPPAGEPLDAPTLQGTDELLQLSRDWLAGHAMDAELSTAERAALAAATGTLDAAARERFADAGEGAAVIAWALRCADLPSFDADADAAAIAASLGWLAEAGTTLGSRARLRSRDELGAALDAIGAVHWRLRARTAPAADAGTVSMARWQPDRFAWPEGMTPLALASDGDLALDGGPIAAASPQQLLAGLRRLRARHRAILWLLGQQRDWDAIELSL
ncbi:MAG: DUF4272 domain-containing protein [Steroidobacteraceae bacterium]|jgi:hypothetical protein|nr:DUF4272 domain-containing protein [Steroidobacteraceae bacterium]